MKVYPIFLNNLSGRRVVVFGGSHEAERKVRELLVCDAAVMLVSRKVTPYLADVAADGHIAWEERAYQSGDLRGAVLAIATEIDPIASRQIAKEARDENVLLNAMDDVPNCTFVAGSVVRQGDLVIAISTSGSAPALAVRLREEFEQRFGPAYARFLSWMRALRTPMKARYEQFEERRTRWYQLIDSNVLTLLKEEKEDEAQSSITQLTGLALPPKMGEKVYSSEENEIA